MKTSENKIIELVDSYMSLNDMAYINYKPSVDMYISQLKNGENICENRTCKNFLIVRN